MRIAMIFHSLNVAGGSASAFFSLANALQEQGNKVDVYCYYYDAGRCFPELNKSLNIHFIKDTSKLPLKTDNTSLWLRFELAYEYYINARKIFSIMKSNKYDAIFASEACAYVPGLIYKNKFGVPLFWSVFDPISLVDKERPGLLMNKHKWFEYALRFHNLIDSKKIKKIDRVIVPTRKMKKRLDSFYKINADVLPLAGVRMDDFVKDKTNIAKKRLKTKFNYKKKKEKILFSNGHFLPHRRYEDALMAVKELIDKGIDIKYIISGSDKFDLNYFGYIEKLVKDLGLNKHVILDKEFKTNNEIIGYYQFCDIFIFVSVEQTWGIAPFEAMMSKKPVIISSGVGSSEILTNGQNAIIIKEKSPMELQVNIERLFNNKDVYGKLANNGFDFVSENFTYKSIATKLHSVFQTCSQE